MSEWNAGRGYEPPVLQRYRDYARQRQMTLSDLLLENRIVFLGSSPETGGNPAITDYLANITIQKLLFLQYENKNQEINMYINCPGGSVTATLAIYDTMQFLECPISTYCMGLAASGAAIILVAGSKGKRFALPHSKIMKSASNEMPRPASRRRAASTKTHSVSISVPSRSNTTARTGRRSLFGGAVVVRVGIGKCVVPDGLQSDFARAIVGPPRLGVHHLGEFRGRELLRALVGDRKSVV